MTFDLQGETMTVAPQDATVEGLVAGLKIDHDKWKDYHILLVLDGLDLHRTIDWSGLEALSIAHKDADKSFVLVSATLGYDDFPEHFSVAPTTAEGHDLIGMEDIERNLGL